MEENIDKQYYKGYLAGYWDGVNDIRRGRLLKPDTDDLMMLPVEAMTVSVRARNCLLRSGCAYICDVVSLEEQAIATMRNLGAKTASEIAQWMIAHGIMHSIWTNYL